MTKNVKKKNTKTTTEKEFEKARKKHENRSTEQKLADFLFQLMAEGCPLNTLRWAIDHSTRFVANDYFFTPKTNKKTQEALEELARCLAKEIIS